MGSPNGGRVHTRGTRLTAHFHHAHGRSDQWIVDHYSAFHLSPRTIRKWRQTNAPQHCRDELAAMIAHVAMYPDAGSDSAVRDVAALLDERKKDHAARPTDAVVEAVSYDDLDDMRGLVDQAAQLLGERFETTPEEALRWATRPIAYVRDPALAAAMAEDGRRLPEFEPRVPLDPEVPSISREEKMGRLLVVLMRLQDGLTHYGVGRDAMVWDGTAEVPHTLMRQAWNPARGEVVRGRAIARWLHTNTAAGREWISAHPAHLMIALGQQCRWFHLKGLDFALTYRRLLLLGPRGSGKSGIFAHLAAWYALSPPEVYCGRGGVPYQFTTDGVARFIGPHNIRLLVSAGVQVRAGQVADHIRAILAETELVKLLFGDLVGKRWEQSFSVTSLRTESLREATITASSIRARGVVGGHYDVVIPDDWVTQESVSDTARAQLEAHWSMTLMGCMEPWSRVFGSGTRYHPQDWYATVIEWREQGTWQVLRIQALTFGPTGEWESYWPEVYSVALLLDRKKSMSDLAFQAQYQNSVDKIAGGWAEISWTTGDAIDDLFARSDKDRAVFCVGVDTASPGATGVQLDYSAFVVLGFVAPFTWVVECRRGQWTADQHVQVAKDIYAKFPRIHKFGVESIGVGAVIAEMMRTARLPVVPITPQSFRKAGAVGKIGRANLTRIFWERGFVKFCPPTAQNGLERVIQEVQMFRMDKESSQKGVDDCVDALIYGMLTGGAGSARVRSQVRLGRSDY